MQTKMIEIRDTATCIPALCIRMEAGNKIEKRYLWRCGYPDHGGEVVLMHLSSQKATVDPYDWPGGARTLPVAHDYIRNHWAELSDGDVVDVRVIAKEEALPAEAEIWTKELADAGR